MFDYHGQDKIYWYKYFILYCFRYSFSKSCLPKLKSITVPRPTKFEWNSRYCNIRETVCKQEDSPWLRLIWNVVAINGIFLAIKPTFCVIYQVAAISRRCLQREFSKTLYVGIIPNCIKLYILCSPKKTHFSSVLN